MYEELVKRLRDKASGLDYDGWVDTAASLEEAADAIEELIPFKKQVEKGMGLLDKAEELLNAVKPRWIPVTEHLPKKNQIVVVHEGKETWDFGMFRGISPSGNPEYWHWKKNTVKRVKWWMPKDDALPEPPEEDTDGEKLHYDSNDLDDGTFQSCPFCGGEAFLALYSPSFTNDHYYYVVCEDCGARSKPTAKTTSEAIKDWNRRHKP